MIDRNSIIREAINRCLAEMYAKSQPRGNWYEYLRKAKRGEIGRDERIYERHYLCQAQFYYILNKYKEAYRCVDEWKSDIDYMIENLRDGGYRDIWVHDKNDPKNGHREAEKTPKLSDIVGKEKAQEIINLIEDIRDFYRFDRDSEKLGVNVALGASPCSNAKTVKDY